jgi:hypothetical protein
LDSHSTMKFPLPVGRRSTVNCFAEYVGAADGKVLAVTVPVVTEFSFWATNNSKEVMDSLYAQQREEWRQKYVDVYQVTITI